MLNRLSVLLQGIGFGIAATAMQGLVYISVEIPQEVARLDSYGPLLRSQPVSAHYKLGGAKAQLVYGKLKTSAGVTIGLAGSDLLFKNGTVQAKAGSLVALVPVKMATVSGKLLATGRHDLSDEELAAMLLEILDAT